MSTAPPSETPLAVPLSAQHRELIEQAAAATGESLDDFAARALLQRAQQVTHIESKPVLAEGDANGALPSPPERSRQSRFESGQLLPNSERVILDDLSMIGWRMLPSYAQEAIRITLDALAARATADWPRGPVEHWGTEEHLYALHTMVGPDHLLVLFRREGDCLRLRHLVLKETIDRYFTPRNRG
jgi:uncharacterized protein (DUF1778 family)